MSGRLPGGLPVRTHRREAVRVPHAEPARGLGRELDLPQAAMATPSDHPEVINYVYGQGRVFVPGRPGRDLSRARPDWPTRTFPWTPAYTTTSAGRTSARSSSCEVLSLDDPDKDLVRNVELYLQVPSIKEYWLLDAREDAEPPFHARLPPPRQALAGSIEVGPRRHYTTPLLPAST